MAEECVVGVYDSLTKAQQAMHILDRGDFPVEQISLVTRDLMDQHALVDELKMGDDSVHDAAIGAGLGGVVGVLTGIAATVVSGLGVVFLAGTIAGAVIGAVTGAFLGGLAGWGVHEERIRHYQQLVEKGKVLVIAHGDPLQLVEAERILKETDVAELHVHAKTDAESPEVQA
jgi:uncharacterized membrane protein